MREIKLCITGELRSGKSTAGDYLERIHSAMPFAFGDDLKKDFHRDYPQISRNPKPRKGYQLYGQFMRYIHGESYWLDRCFSKIDYVRDIAYNYGAEEFNPMITDARQPNEFEACRENGFFIIKIVCPEELRLERAKAAGDTFSPEDMQHETETYISKVKADYTVVNMGEKEQLYADLDKVMMDIQSHYGVDTIR